MRLAQDWLGSPDWALPSIAALIIYHELGFGVILFLARLLSLPEEVFQAARIDGCRWFRMHLRVTCRRCAPSSARSSRSS